MGGEVCLFCSIATERVVVANSLALATYDNYPVSKGHTLVIPRRHVVSFFDTTHDERLALLKLLDDMKTRLDREHKADGYNIGVNNGAAAGQTVMHLHIHLIPRYKGDRVDPRGGVRWVIPDRARYW